ncbi:hypothetical protein CDAR_549561 [Caerostris darwini]|uniref:Uncharacterized protein n=1 Tax=Caerostris darwini TaxID=1538125 RepID=A0AAV4V8A5_9ARAC|nr:hypothetical protein CDAR_549561 [Caerostris darwini]
MARHVDRKCTAKALNRGQQAKSHEWFIIGQEEASIPGNGDMTNSTPNCNCTDCIETSRISGQHKNSDISSTLQTSPESNPFLCYILVKKRKRFAATFLHQLQSARVKKSRLFYPLNFSLLFGFIGKLGGK